MYPSNKIVTVYACGAGVKDRAKGSEPQLTNDPCPCIDVWAYWRMDEWVHVNGRVGALTGLRCSVTLTGVLSSQPLGYETQNSRLPLHIHEGHAPIQPRTYAIMYP